MKRRDFIKNTALTVAGTTVITNFSFARSVISNRKLGDEEFPSIQGVYLITSDPTKYKYALTVTGINDIESSWAINNTLSISINGNALSLKQSIANIGNSTTNLCYLWVLIKTANKSSIIKIRKNITIPSLTSITVDEVIDLKRNGILSDQISAVYTFVFDPLLDSFDFLQKELLRAANGEVAFTTNRINFSRISRKIACWTSNKFILNGNQLSTSGQNIKLEFAIVNVDAADDADIIINNLQQNLIDKLQERPKKRVLGQSYLISEGQLEIHLKNRVTGNVFSSSDPSRCRITLLSDHVVNLDWEDSGDGSFGDYITRLIIA